MEESNAIEGVITAVRKDGKGFQIDGLWYSSFFAIITPVKKGDLVSFEFKKKGDFNNILPDTLQIKKSSSVEQLSSPFKYSTDNQKYIIRQSCLKAAVEAIKEGREEYDYMTIINLAEQFEKWVNRE